MKNPLAIVLGVGVVFLLYEMYVSQQQNMALRVAVANSQNTVQPSIFDYLYQTITGNAGPSPSNPIM